jgi:hypothetical protein
MALCVTLLAGAGLLARSLWAMAAAPLGFAPDRVLAAAVQLPRGARTTTRRRACASWTGSRRASGRCRA